MKKILRLKDMFLDSEKINSIAGKVYTEIYIDPTRKEMNEAFQRDYSAITYGDLRGFITITGNLFIAICEEAELVHDQLLKLISEKTSIDYNQSWETSQIRQYLAVFINPNFSMYPSENSYNINLDQTILNDYAAAIGSNSKISYLDFMIEEK